ncbi:MAG: DUF4942 domain-containing protein, partial [Ruminococcus sp.]|nr:DUF4942 domain-containing protein [Ruminococcus sp.]
LTKELRQKYYSMVDRLQHYEFSEFNIYSLSAEINSKIKVGIEDEIVVMFDRMTAEYTWYDETSKNIHYFNGWKTNKAHKIGNKVILPVDGFTTSYWKGDTKKPDFRRAYDGLVDLEKILNYFDGQMCADVDLSYALDTAFNAGITKNIKCKFFSVTFYKKGTCHIKFYDSDRVRELIDRFNIYACQRKGWLPPSYGKKTYTNMTSEEKAVIDSFQGEKEYEKVLVRKDYFLSSPVENQTLMLEEAIA